MQVREPLVVKLAQVSTPEPTALPTVAPTSVPLAVPTVAPKPIKKPKGKAKSTKHTVTQAAPKPAKVEVAATSEPTWYDKLLLEQSYRKKGDFDNADNIMKEMNEAG